MNKSETVKSEDRAEQELELSRDGVAEISRALRGLLADVFALYLKTKNFHWHMSGRHFRDYHLLLDEGGGEGDCRWRRFGPGNTLVAAHDRGSSGQDRGCGNGNQRSHG